MVSIPPTAHLFPVTMTFSHIPPSPKRQFPGTGRRQPRRLTSQSLVHCDRIIPESSLPQLMQPVEDSLNLLAWAKTHGPWLQQQLQQVGGILFRNFQIQGLEEFQEFVECLGGPPLTYTYGSTPRQQVQGQVYTSTDYPPHRTIPLHNEMAYSRHWPEKIAFFCVQPAQSGGATPIADSRRIWQRLSPEVRDRLEQRQILYVRNYGEGLDLSWQQAFGTENRTQVEAACRQRGIDWEWNGEALTTRQVCQAVAIHPLTGEKVWFNQAHLFHLSNLPPQLQATLQQGGRLPRNAYYGDGAELEADVLAEIRAAYEAETVMFPWQAGDVLLLDNLLAAHGRTPFEGDRRVLVAMAGSGQA